MAAKTFSSSSSSSSSSNISSSSTSSNVSWIYDVFLSFRGEDTRKTFTDHLYHALKGAGIDTFRDDDELRRGEDITSGLVKAIQGSRISVVVFSRNYATSRWCLQELAEIMECKRIHGQTVLPIFYDVDPSDVRHQKGSFEKAFTKHEECFVLQMDKVATWRAALFEVADLSGWSLKDVADGYEGKFIKKIVDDILEKLKHLPLLEINEPLIEIDSHMQKMNLLLNVGSDDVRMVGICGMGGIGKTTIANVIFNRLFDSFESRSFITNVKEMGKVQIQERFLSDILMTSEIKISDINRGINLIRRKVFQKRVILILDDIDELEQLNVVAGSRDWFGSGSRIIITTRDQDLLKTVNSMYMVEKMNNIDSLKLFSLYAFGENDPTADCKELAKGIVAYCGGLPLALKVLGSFLSNKNVLEWKSTLEKLRLIPNKEIMKKLRISYDSLSDDMVKNIFLDISCFFVGMNKDYVIQILNGCGFCATIGLRILIDKCLVTIGGAKELMMHDLLRDMGREIIREESNEPGERSRLWYHEDVIKILENKMGTKAIEGLTLKLSEKNGMNMDTKEFSQLQKLRLLQFHHVQLNGGYENFSRELRLLCWRGCPLKFIPNEFNLGNIVAIDLQHSNLRKVWKDSKVLEKLKFLDLSHSHHLTRTPDFSKFPILEELKLKDCKRLVEVHQSIGNLERLVLVDLTDCKELKSLPLNFCQLKSLKTLFLSGCSKLDMLPQDLGNLKSLAILLEEIITGTRRVVQNLPQFSLVGFTGSLSNSLISRLWSWILPGRSPNAINLSPSSLQGLRCLKMLLLRDCNLSNDAIPKDLWNLSFLEKLNLGGNNFLSLPTGISNLSKLHFLVLDNCTSLQAIEDLPSSLIFLTTINCTSLERLPDLEKCKSLHVMSLINCHKLCDAGRIDILRKAAFLIPWGKGQENTSEEDKLQVWHMGCIGGVILPGDEIPDWFAYKKEGSSIIFDLQPQFAGDDLLSLDVCCAVSCDPLDFVSPRIKLCNESKGYIMIIWPPRFETFPQGDHLWRCELDPLEFDIGSEDKVKIQVEFHDPVGFWEPGNVKKIGVHPHFKIHNEVSNEGDDEEATQGEAGIKAEASNNSNEKELRRGARLRETLMKIVLAVTN